MTLIEKMVEFLIDQHPYIIDEEEARGWINGMSNVELLECMQESENFHNITY